MRNLKKIISIVGLQFGLFNGGVLAATVPSDVSFTLGPLGSNSGTVHVVDIATNVNNGDYAVCWAVDNLTNVVCSHRDSDDVEIKNINIANANPNAENLSVDFNNAGDIYVMWSTATDARVTAYDVAGNQLFPPVGINSNLGGWLSVSMSLTPSGFWIFGTRDDTLFDANFGYRFGPTGNMIAFLDIPLINNDAVGNCQATMASNRSGDLILTWVQRTPENNPECRGNIMGMTFRESGTALSDVLSISGNSDTAYYGNPKAIADEAGEFVIVWDEDDPKWQPPQNPVSCPACNFSYVSRITTFNGGTSLPAQVLLEGINPRIGSGESGKDFAVIANQPFGPGICQNSSRWALRGELDPEVLFQTLDCDRLFMNLDLLADDSMLLVYTEDQGGLMVKAKRYYKPVEIEVGDVTIIEGNPTEGQGPFAVLSVGLSKVHPTSEQVSVNYFTRDITATQGEDYVYVSGTTQFPAGNILSEILVPVIPDTEYERTETLSFNLELADNAVIRTNKAIVSIANDDSTPPVLNDCDNINGYCKIADEPLDGQFSTLEIILSIENPQELDIAFTYQTVDGTATAGQDYVSSGGSVEIAAGATETSLFITLIGDLVLEGTESFDIEFATTSQISIPEPVLTLGITDGTTCQAELSPTGHNVPLEGGDRSFDIQTLPDCDWNLTTAEDWIQITSPISGTGPATVNYSVDSRANPEVLSRLGAIDVNLLSPASTTSHTVIQDGDPSLCGFDIDESSFNFDEGLNSGTIQVTAISECVWEVFSDVEWMTITSPLSPVSGNGTIQFSVHENVVNPNVPTDPRSTILDAPFGTDVVINQTGCDFSLTQDQVSIDDLANDSVTTTILAPDNQPSACSWTAQSQVSWILVTSGNSGQGGGEVIMNVLENPSVTPRVGTVQIGNDVFTVNQSGQPCVYDINTDQLDVCPDGLNDQLGVLATAGCAWNLSTDQNWLQVISNVSGVGDEIAEFTVQTNDGTSSRSASISLLSADMNTQIDKNIQQSGYLVFEDFTVLPTEFNFTAGQWQSSNGSLNANMLGNGLAFAYDGDAYCSDCKVEGTVQLSSFSSTSQQNIGLVGWYQNPSTYISLTMNEFMNTWRLSLFKNGTESFIDVSEDSLVPSQNYHLVISYDDVNIYGFVNGDLLLQLPHNLVLSPSGYPGFILNNSNGLFDDLRVTGNLADSDLIFNQSFEPPVFNAPSICSQ